MNNAISAPTQVATPPVSPLRAVPVAVWAVVGVLALATAGLTGALVMRSTGSAPATPAAVQAPAPEKLAAAEPAPTTATTSQQQGTQVHAAQAVAQEHPAPVRHTPKPAPARPVQVAQAPETVQPAPVQSVPVPAPVQVARAPVCATCGTVESVQAIQQKGQGTGLGAIAGGVLGGVVGNQFGGGHGRTALTVVGAAGGALAGNEVEKRARASTSYDVRVRMEDGSVRTVRLANAPAVGTRVAVEGSQLRPL